MLNDQFNYTIKLFNLDSIENIDKERTTFSFDDLIPECNLFLDKNIFYCEYCMSEDIKFKEYSNMNIKHTTFNGSLSNIIFHRRKYKCNYCHKYTYETLGLLKIHRGISQALDMNILESLKDPTNTYKKVSEIYNVSKTYVLDTFDKYVDVKREILSDVLCIDEIYAKKLTKTKYCCILYNPIDDRVVDVIDSRRINTLDDYFYHISYKERQNTKYFISDLNETYRTIHNRFFKNSIHAVDSFHVIKNLYDALNQVRIREMKKLESLKDYSNSSYWLLKKFNKLLFKRLEDIYDKEYNFRKFDMILNKYELIDEMLKCSKELREAYYLTQEYKNFNDCYKGDEVKDKLNELIDEFRNSNVDEMKRFSSTLLSWKDEIINSFIYIGKWRLSNGRMERANRYIKLMFSNAFGYSNFPRTRNRIMYSYNKDESLLNSPRKFSIKRIMKPRGKYKNK